MPRGLKRYYGAGDLHYITWSCFRRQPLLGAPELRDLFLSVSERMRKRYCFAVIGYMVMPEHVHLLVSEPRVGNPSTVVQAIKLGFVHSASDTSVPAGQFWQRPFLRFQPVESAQRN